LLFPQLEGKCQGKTHKDGARTALFLVVVLFYAFFVLFYVFLCCSMYCLFFDVLCIVCVYMCTELLPPGGYPIAVKYIISYRAGAGWTVRGSSSGKGKGFSLLQNRPYSLRGPRSLLFNENQVSYWG